MWDVADARQSSKGSVPPSARHIIDRMQEKMIRGNVDANNVNHSSLSEEKMKSLYLSFVSGFLPSAIIAATGLSSALVEIEYERFLRFKGRDISSFQQQLFLLMTSKGFIDQRLTELRKGELPINELVSLTEVFSKFQFEAGIKRSVEDRFSPLPEGWKRVLCLRCGLPVEGAIIKPTEEMGKAFEYLLTSSRYARKCSCENTVNTLIGNLCQIENRRGKELAEKTLPQIK